VCIKTSKKDIVSETGRLVKDLRMLAESPTCNSKVIYEHLLLVAKINNLIDESLKQIREQCKEHVYVVPSLFLHESFNLLNQDKENESLHFVTGPEIRGIKILDKIMGFRIEEQNAAYAKADSYEVSDVLIKLHKYSFKLLGYFHIHPGTGIDSTFPSSTDLALENLLNKGNYEAVGAIFSRDGFVRFFSSDDFRIDIYGRGVERINEKLYRIVKIS
jgi:proteasome lid subunit RPN8/RPN11